MRLKTRKPHSNSSLNPKMELLIKYKICNILEDIDTEFRNLSVEKRKADLGLPVNTIENKIK